MREPIKPDMGRDPHQRGAGAVDLRKGNGRVHRVSTGDLGMVNSVDTPPESSLNIIAQILARTVFRIEASVRIKSR